MCGIVGAVAQQNVTPILLEGLKRLEYRGYDSCGVALHVDGKLQRSRSTSRVADLQQQVAQTGLSGFTGIAHTRKQETDRVAGMARELKKLGQDVREENDALTISPRPLTTGVEIETYHDHRFAMSFGILGCHDLLKNGRPWLSIKDPGCCAKTFPNFFELLDALREKSSGN